MEKLIIQETGITACKFITSHIDLNKSDNLIVSTSTRFNIENQPDQYYHAIINLKRINDIRRLNKYFETVNSKLQPNGIFIDSVETYQLRKKRIMHKFWPGINYLIYFLDFIIKRILPKLSITKGIYFFITRGNNRVLSKAETFGRLYSCGFEIIEEKQIGHRLYFAVKKVKKPVFDYHPTYGPLIRLKRVGKNGVLFNVYKLRTMHAYSEYLQKYIFELNALQEGGKFADDFRVTTLGHFFRKFWLDELPMFLNVIKGDMKIVGVRPLSNHYFSLYNESLQKRRTQFKPGLIPPFYVDLPKTLDEIQESEARYLDAYEKSPLRTDIIYFYKAVVNILFKKARSK